MKYKFKKGNTAWNNPITKSGWFKKGHKINNGREFSDEHKINIGLALHGKKFSKSHLKNLRIACQKKERRDKISFTRIKRGLSRNEKNPSWKGDKVKYNALHIWIKRRKIRSLLCEECNKRKSRDLSNISGEYKRDINDYRWLCRSCHKKEHGKIRKLNMKKNIKLIDILKYNGKRKNK